jgi:hypothetical protein
MSIQKVIPDRVTFNLRLPRTIEEKLRRRAAESWKNRAEFVRDVLARELARLDREEAQRHL